MDPVGGWTTIGASALFLVAAWFPLRRMLSGWLADLLTAACGAGVGVGGLLLLHDVGLASWIVAPVLTGLGAFGHRRALFSGAGPFRT